MIADDGYYSLMGGYDGHHLAWAEVDTDGSGPEPITRGLMAGYSWRSAGGVDVVLSVGAVTGASNPDAGWAPGTAALVSGAVTWATGAELAIPAAPTLSAAAPLTADPQVDVSGVAAFGESVQVRRVDGQADPVLATVEVARDGTWAAGVPLVEGPNVLVAEAVNPAGTSPRSGQVTVVRDSTPPDLDLATPSDRAATLAATVDVGGTVTDAHDVALTVNGADVPVADNGTFSASVAVPLGESVVTVVATDVLGNATTVERAVLRLDARATWQVRGTGRGPTPVQITVSGPEAERVLRSAAVLRATDADGTLRATSPCSGTPAASTAWSVACRTRPTGWRWSLTWVAGPSPSTDRSCACAELSRSAAGARETSRRCRGGAATAATSGPSPEVGHRRAETRRASSCSTSRRPRSDVADDRPGLGQVRRAGDVGDHAAGADGVER